MGRLMPQLEFRWVSWLRVPALPAPVQEGTAKQDCRLTAWCVETCKGLYLNELSRRIGVSWNSRMQTTAGRAWWPDRAIELNPKLKDLPSEELWRTLKHELAHLIAYERAGRRHTDPHGPEWQAACAELGIPNEQPFHTLPFKRRKMKRNYAYLCPNCLTVLQRVKPIRRTVACYACCRKFNNGAYHSRYRLIAQRT
ncbi:MAG: SprT family zinc-dependent metalloprotease [Verrucomicrobia bacterium]|nr:SprT family zinc-dependent metalloprotease [Verrucomicrobiota bacterium]